MYCKNCGKELDDKAFVCPFCGVLTGEGKATREIPNNVKNVLENYVNLMLCLSVFFGFIGALIASTSNRKYLDEQIEGGHIDRNKDIFVYMSSSQKVKFIVSLIFAIAPIVIVVCLLFSSIFYSMY